MTPDAIAHVKDGGLTRAGVLVDDVDDGTALASEAQQWCTEGSKRSKRITFKPFASVDVEHFLPLLKRTHGTHVRGDLFRG